MWLCDFEINATQKRNKQKIHQKQLTDIFQPIMSDGIFNRSMLPSNSYQSGVRAGRSQMRIKAIQLLDELLNEELVDVDEGKRAEFLQLFRQRLG